MTLSTFATTTFFGLATTFALTLTLTLATGCSGASDTPETGAPPAPASSMPNKGNDGERANADQDEAATDPAEEDEAAVAGDPASPADKGGGKPGANDAPANADPACVASCTANMKTKCQGDDAFCADICSGMTTAQVACIGAAPSCDKPEWIRCVDENPGK